MPATPTPQLTIDSLQVLLSESDLVPDTVFMRPTYLIGQSQHHAHQDQQNPQPQPQPQQPRLTGHSRQDTRQARHIITSDTQLDDVSELQTSAHRVVSSKPLRSSTAILHMDDDDEPFVCHVGLRWLLLSSMHVLLDHDDGNVGHTILMDPQTATVW